MLETVFSAWREVLHVSEWTGLSAGMLLGLGALAWFYPPIRTLAITLAVNVACVYGGLLYGNHVGRADAMAQWDAANARAEKDREARDAKIAAELEAKYGPEMAAMVKKSTDLETLVTSYERQILAQKSGSCQLGDGAIRLRNGAR